MEKELADILSKQEQLRAMQESVHDFMVKLKDQQDRFLKEHLGFKEEDKNVSVFEMIRRVRDKRIIT